MSTVRSEPVEEPCFDRLSTNGFMNKSCRINIQGGVGFENITT